MTDGSSQGLFVIVAVVIFGIFVVISYLLFRDKLQTGLASIFTDSINNSISVDSVFNNTIKEKEYFSETNTAIKEIEFLNSDDWDLSPIGNSFDNNQIFTLTFDLKTSSDQLVLVYTQNGSGTKYLFPYTYISGKTNYQKFAVTFKLKKGIENETKSLLAFYSLKNSGVKIAVKNVTLERGNVLDSLSSDYKKYDNYK